MSVRMEEQQVCVCAILSCAIIIRSAFIKVSLVASGDGVNRE